MKYTEEWLFTEVQSPEQYEANEIVYGSGGGFRHLMGAASERLVGYVSGEFSPKGGEEIVFRFERVDGSSAGHSSGLYGLKVLRLVPLEDSMWFESPLGAEEN